MPMTMTTKILRRREGFTLIEIAVVVIILGFLTAIAIPSYFSWVERSRAYSAILTLKNVRDQLETLFVAQGTNVCNGQTEPLTGAFATLVYGVLDTAGAGEYFLIGTAADTQAGASSVGCNAGVLWIDALRSHSIAFSGTDPCASGSNPQCKLNICGGWGFVNTSGVTMCRDTSGNYFFQGLGMEFGVP